MPTGSGSSPDTPGPRAPVPAAATGDPVGDALALGYRALGRRDRTVSEVRSYLLNHGCDEPAIGGKIPGWETVQGSWMPGGGGRLLPQAGAAFFHPKNSGVGRLRQDIDLRGYAALIDAGRLTGEFVGYVQSTKQKPSDTTRIVLEYRDDNETVLSAEALPGTALESANRRPCGDDAESVEVGAGVGDG